jgi:hypothetical protein
MSLIDERRHVSKVAVDSLAAEVGLRNLESTARHDDERVRRAFRDVLSQGKIPGPTRLFQTAPRVAEQHLALEYGGDALTKLGDGRYQLRLEDAASGAACDLIFTLEKRPVRYGRDGVVHGVTGERMFGTARRRGARGDGGHRLVRSRVRVPAVAPGRAQRHARRRAQRDVLALAVAAAGR